MLSVWYILFVVRFIKEMILKFILGLRNIDVSILVLL